MAALSIDVGRKNLALCLLRPGPDPVGREDVIVRWTVTSCEPTPRGLRDALDRLGWALECEEVVIERQPNRNATMSRLQHYLEMYFVVHDKAVTVIDPKHKLSFAAGTPWWPTEDLPNWNYRTRKRLAVQTMTAFLEASGQEEWAAVLRGSSKKDDYADSALQAMAFAHHVRRLELTKRGVRDVIKPRKPTPKQLETGRYSKPNVAWFLRGRAADAELLASENKHLARAIDKHFGSVEACVRALSAA